MKILSIFFISLSLLLSTGCAVLNPQQKPVIDLNQNLSPEHIKAQRQMLIGTWYRSQPTTEGGVNQEICTMKDDGTYLFKFRNTDANGIIESWGEVGYWGISGNVHFTITHGYVEGGEIIPSDPTDAGNYLVYKVINLSEKSFTYQTTVTGNVFTLNRVSDGYDFLSKNES